MNGRARNQQTDPRWSLFSTGLVLLATAAWSVMGCDASHWQTLLEPSPSSTPTVPVKLPSGHSTPIDTPADQGVSTVTLASFNIQSFGPTKMGNATVMAILVDVVRHFDIVAIQEIRSLDQTIVERFVQQINAHGAAYRYVLSPRLGRGSYQEQYAFIYNTRRVALVPGSVYTVMDERDDFHREPMVATFYARTDQSTRPFTFTLVNIHTDPDDVSAELSVLDDVVQGIRRLSPEDDVIVIGDLNARPERYGHLLHLPSVGWALRDGQATNTRRTKSYDNLVFDQSQTVEFTGRAGVIDVESVYQLDRAAALKVSDHLPVWAEFYAAENARPQRPTLPLARRTRVIRI